MKERIIKKVCSVVLIVCMLIGMTSPFSFKNVNASEPEQKTPEELGYERVTMQSFGFSDGSYSTEQTPKAYSEASLNMKYLDVDMTLPGTSGVSAYMVFASTGQWDGYRIYGAGDALAIYCVNNTDGVGGVVYTPADLEIETVKNRFNLKFGVKTGEGTVSYSLWINDVLIAKDVTNHVTSGIGNKMTFLAGTAIKVRTPIEQKTPEELGYERVTIEDFGLPDGTYNIYTGVKTSGRNLNMKYLDVDMSISEGTGVSAYLMFGGLSEWGGYRLYGAGDVFAVHCVENNAAATVYTTEDMGITSITEQFNVKFGVKFGETTTSYCLWINDVLIAQDVISHGTSGMGNYLSVLQNSRAITLATQILPIEQNTPEELGYERVTIADFNLPEGTYNIFMESAEYKKGSLNNKYLDINLIMPETNSAMITYAGNSQWYGFRIYTSGGNLIILSTLDNRAVYYTPERLGLSSITEPFNMKLATKFGEGYLSGICDASYCLWINDVLVAKDVTYFAADGMGNQMTLLQAEGGNAITWEIPREEPFAEITASDFGIKDGKIAQENWVGKYDKESLNATAVTMNLQFSAQKEDAIYFGGDNTGIRFAAGASGTIDVSYVNSEKEVVSVTTLKPEKAGVTSFVNESLEWRFTFRIYEGEEKNILKLAIYINGKFYEYQNYIVENVSIENLQCKIAICSKVGTFRVTSAGYEELTFRDFSIPNADIERQPEGSNGYINGNYCDLALLDNTAFTGIFNFGETAIQDRIELGGQDWGGLNIMYIADGTIRIFFSDRNHKGAFVQKQITYLRPELVGMESFSGKDLKIRVTFNLMEVEEDTYDLRLGVYVNDKLYENKHFDVQDVTLEMLTRTLRIKIYEGPCKMESVKREVDLSIYGLDKNWKQTLKIK